MLCYNDCKHNYFTKGEKQKTMVTDVISKLANQGIYLLITTRNSKGLNEDALPITAIGKILLVHAILKSYGNTVTISREELAAMCNMRLSTAITIYGRVLYENNLLDVTHEGRSVYYTFVTNARDMIKPPVYIPLGAISKHAYLLQSPSFPIRNLREHEAMIKEQGLLPEDGTLTPAYLMLGYDYNKYMDQANWRWDTDDVMSYFSTNRDHYKLKAVYLAMNDVKRLPNKFEVLKSDFWDVCTPGFIAQCNADAFEGTRTPTWESFPPEFYDPDTPDAERFALYSSAKYGSSLRQAPTALTSPLASLAKLKAVTSTGKDIVEKAAEVKAESDAHFKEEAERSAITSQVTVIHPDRGQLQLAGGLTRPRNVFDDVAMKLASEESNDEGQISREDDKNSSEVNLVSERGISDKEKPENNQDPKVNNMSQPTKVEKLDIKSVWPTCDFVPPEVEPDYGAGPRPQTIAELRHKEVRDQLFAKLRRNEAAKRTPYVNQVGAQLKPAITTTSEDQVDILVDIRTILDCNLPDRIKRIVLKNLLTKA